MMCNLCNVPVSVSRLGPEEKNCRISHKSTNIQSFDYKFQICISELMKFYYFAYQQKDFYKYCVCNITSYRCQIKNCLCEIFNEIIFSDFKLS